MYLTPHIIIIAGSIIALGFIIGLVWLIRLNIRLNRMLRGKGATSLEDSMKKIVSDFKDLNQFTKEMEQYLTTVEHRLKHSVQAVETIRYNPFKGTGSGGNNSFSTTLLDEHGNGVVLTGLYARDRISMFAKPINNFKSEHELSEEELESLTSCQQKLTTKP